MSIRTVRNLACGLILLAGCSRGGPVLAPVKGVVKLDGQPLAGARVVFQPSGPGSSPSSAATAEDGSFELAFNRERKGALLGKHTIKVTTAGLVSDASGKETIIPEKLGPHYNRLSELNFEVEAKPNTFEILLDSKRKPGKKAIGTLATVPNPC